MTTQPKPLSEKTHEHQFPPGAVLSWKAGDAPAMLMRFHAPSIQVVGEAQPPIEFLGSFDGKTYELIRDIDGDPYRATKAGVFQLPVAVAWLQPVIKSSAIVKTFIGHKA